MTGRLIAPLAEMRIVDEFDNDVEIGNVGGIGAKKCSEYAMLFEQRC